MCWDLSVWWYICVHVMYVIAYWPFHLTCDVLAGRRYLKEISKLRLTDTRICKVTKHRTFSLAVHPSASQLLVAAGDKWGGVGIWNIVSVCVSTTAAIAACGCEMTKLHTDLRYKMLLEVTSANWNDAMYSLLSFLAVLLVWPLTYACIYSLHFSLVCCRAPVWGTMVCATTPLTPDPSTPSASPPPRPPATTSTLPAMMAVLGALTWQRRHSLRWDVHYWKTTCRTHVTRLSFLVISVRCTLW